MKSNWEKGFDKLGGRLGLSGRESGPQMTKLVRAAQIASLQEHRRLLLEAPRLADSRRLPKFGYRVYSQSDEDGILHEIFRRIGERNRTFVELGSGDGLENNTLFLLVQGWRGLWLEGSERRVTSAKRALAREIREGRLTVAQHFVTAKNVNEAIARHAPEGELDLLSIDLDGNDYYILEAVQAVKPRVIVAEYNAKFPPDVAWTIEYNEAHRWDATDYYGASLKALEILLAKRGYVLVGCNLLGSNAFFIREELATDPPFCSPFTAENHYEPARFFLLRAFESSFPVRIGPSRIIKPE